MRVKFWLSVVFGLICLGASASSTSAQWTNASKSLTGSDLNAVYFDNSKRGWVAGDNGFLAITKDSGQTWTPLSINTKEAISDIYFRGADKGYVIAGERVFASVDGGESWREETILDKNELTQGTPELYSLRFANKKNGWIVGSVNKNNAVIASLVLHSDDGGKTWRRVRVPTATELIHVDFINENTGWIVGANGTILKTVNAGDTWTAQKSQTTAAIYHVNFRNDNLGWAVGEKGLILRTVDGGATWQKIASNTAKTLLSVEFINDRDGFAVGRGGVILRSSDGGETWKIEPSGTTENLFAFFLNKKVAWAVGGKGTILRAAR